MHDRGLKGRTGVDSTEDVGLDFLIAILLKVVDESAKALDGIECGCIVACECLLDVKKWIDSQP
jgi:hypothetical protein